jgi:hypothetical protein
MMQSNLKSLYATLTRGKEKDENKKKTERVAGTTAVAKPTQESLGLEWGRRLPIATSMIKD